MQFFNNIRKFALAALAFLALASSAHATSYSTGSVFYLGVKADLTGKYNLYTAADLLTNGTLVANTQLMKVSLTQQTKLMDSRLSQLSGAKVANADQGTRYVALAGQGSEVAKGQAAGSEGHNWGVWLSGRYTDFKDGDRFYGVKGDSYAAALGTDYRIHSNFIVGLALTYEHADAKTTFLKDSIKNDGYGVVPYVKFIINENFDVDVHGGYTYINTKTSHDNQRYDYAYAARAGKVTGKTSADQWHGVFALNAHTVIADAMTVRGKAGVNFANRKQKAFTQKYSFSTANFGLYDQKVRGFTSELSQAFGELRLGYLVTENIEPFIKGGYAYDVSFKKNKSEVDGQASTVIKQKTDRDSYTYGGGANFVFGQFQAALDYERLEGARKFSSNTYVLLVRYNF